MFAYSIARKDLVSPKTLMVITVIGMFVMAFGIGLGFRGSL